MDIVVKELKAMEQISISTQHSEYCFQVTEPAQCRGFLSGGVFGAEAHEAMLTGSLVPESGRGCISNKLEIGRCALFYVSAKESLRCLITSAITNLKTSV
jgi:hypothetical protein